MKDLTQGNMYKNFFLFSIPIVLSSLLSSAFSIINTSIAGLFLGAEGLAATSVTSSYIIVMGYLITGQSYGLSVYAANLFGAKNYDRLKRVFYSNVFLVFAALVCFTGISILFTKPILHFLNVDAHIFEDASRYFIFHCIAFTISGVNTMFMTCCHSMGETKFPLIVSFFSASLSVLGNLLNVAVFDLGVIGLGISSIFANTVVFFLYWFRLRGYFRKLGVGTKIPKPSLRELKPLFSYSLPNIFQQCSMGAAAFLIAPIRNGLGYLIVAAYSISSNIHGYITTLYYSASKTASNYIAQCVGAKKFHKIKKAVSTALLQGYVFFFVLLIPVWIFSDFVAGLFISKEADPAVFEYVKIYIRIYLPFLSLHVFCGIFHSILRGIKSNTHLIIASLGGSVINLIATYFLAPTFGIHGLFSAQVIGWAFECIYIGILCLTGLWVPSPLRPMVLKRKKKAPEALSES